MVDPVLALVIFFGSIGIVIIVKRVKLWAVIFTKKSQRNKELKEDILKQLYHVEYSGRSAGLNEMAGALKIADEKLVEMIELMALDNLIQSSQNKIQLTPPGKTYALKIIRIHRLWEKHLSERTGVHKTQWHDLAETQEHLMTSDETEELYQRLGSPRFDPHGDPIPMESGEIMDLTWVPLPSLEAGAIGRILHIEDEPEVIYKQIIDNNLHVGSNIRLIESNEQKIHFYCEGTEYTLSPIVASNINVRGLKDEEVYDESQVRLSSLATGEKASVTGISSECRGANRRRLLDLGFIKGTTVQTEYPGPMKNPRAYLIRNTLIALRNDQAELILIEKE